MVHPFSCTHAEPILPESYEFMLETSALTVGCQKFLDDMCVVEVQIYAESEVDFTGLLKTILIAPGKMQLHITGTSIGDRVLALKCSGA